MPNLEPEAQKIRHLDAVDRQIMNLLAHNARTRLIDLAKRVKLSIDSTKKRLLKLERENIITKYTIQVNTAALDLPLGVHIYLKLKDLKEKDYENLIQHLKRDPSVIDLMAMIGDYDLYIVMLTKNTQDLEKKKLKIRQQFSSIIADWKEVLVAEIYKLEEYSF